MATGDTGDPTTKVLVVTSDPVLREGAAYAFPSNTAVRFAADAREAWIAMQEETPSVAVIDIHTGSAGGFSLATEMAQDDRLAKVPIFMLLERDADRWLAREGGAKAIRTKPVPVDHLVHQTLALLE